MAKKKSKKQIEAEIATSLQSRGEPTLAAMFADPQARATFAREMRHELTKNRLSAEIATHMGERPYEVRALESQVPGGRRIRSLMGRYKTEAEARAVADRRDGWVSIGGRVVYGVEKPSDPA